LRHYQKASTQKNLQSLILHQQVLELLKALVALSDLVVLMVLLALSDLVVLMVLMVLLVL